MTPTPQSKHPAGRFASLFSEWLVSFTQLEFSMYVIRYAGEVRIYNTAASAARCLTILGPLATVEFTDYIQE